MTDLKLEILLSIFRLFAYMTILYAVFSEIGYHWIIFLLFIILINIEILTWHITILHAKVKQHHKSLMEIIGPN